MDWGRLGADVMTLGGAEVANTATGGQIYGDNGNPLNVTGNGNGVGHAMNSLFDPITGANATRDAINAQAQATAAANATDLQMYNQNRTDLQPWKQAGLDSLGKMTSGMDDFNKKFTMADFQQDPGYQFRLQQGQNALERSAAASGSLGSGATMKALTNYAQGAASEEYQNAFNRFQGQKNDNFNRLATIANIGQTATGQQVQSSDNTANAISQNQIAMGNAVASANIAGANRMTGLMGTGLMAGAMYFSDRRLKTNVRPVSKRDLDELRKSIKPYFFNYIDDKHGEGDWVGVMAQDLEKTKLGRRLVAVDKNGHKMIDMKKLASLFLATFAEEVA